MMFEKLGRPPVCFCPHCLEYARKRNVDPERAREGFRELVKLWGTRRAGRKQVLRGDLTCARIERPAAGFFVTFLRILFRYPEVLFWSHMWQEHQLAIQREIYRIVKSGNPSRMVGWHLWHRGRGFSPIMRAEEDYEELLEISDFVKPAIFTNPAGNRFLEEAIALSQTIFADLDLDQTVAALYKFNGWPNEGTAQQIKHQPFSTNYVKAEVRLAKEQLKGRVKLYAGIAAAHYTNATTTPETPEQVKADIRAAVEAGADGLLFGSVALDSLGPAIGEGLREVGWT
jgi:hypothetical protein